VNATAVAASWGVSPAALVDRFRKANWRLAEFYGQHDPEKVVIEIKAGARLRTLAQLIPEIEAHIRNHHGALRKNLSPG